MHTTRKIVQNVDSDQSAARHSHCYQDLEAQSGTECHFMLQVIGPFTGVEEDIYASPWQAQTRFLPLPTAEAERQRVAVILFGVLRP
jgi:hypothetical protein